MRSLRTVMLVVLALGALALAGVSGWYALTPTPPQVLRVAVGGKGGNIDTLMGEVAAIVQTQSKTIRLEIVHTDGSATNARLVADRKAELASVQADILAAPSVRLVAAVAREHFQFLTRASAGIRSLRDLEGKRLALPPQGTSGNDNFHAIAAHHHLPLDRISLRAAPVSDNLAALERGEVDAVAFVRALRDPATLETLRRLQQQGDGLAFVPIPQAAALRLVKPYVAEGQIAQGTYQGFPPVPDVDVPTLSIAINLVAGEAVPPEAVEELTRILFEEQLRLAFRTPLGADIARPVRSGPSLPVHAGAQSYYDGTKPFVLLRFREEITFAISLLTLAYSALMMMRLRMRGRRKVRVSAYNAELMRIAALVQAEPPFAELRAARADLDALIQRVMRDFAEERISDQGFQVFSLAWEAVRASLAEAIAEAKLALPGPAEARTDAHALRAVG